MRILNLNERATTRTESKFPKNREQVSSLTNNFIHGKCMIKIFWGGQG